jgi:hypothetical protein
MTFGSWRNFQNSKMWSHTEPYGTEKRKHCVLQQLVRLKQMSPKIRKARPYRSRPVKPQRSPHLSRCIQRRGGDGGSRTLRRPLHPEPRRWSVKHTIATVHSLQTWASAHRNSSSATDTRAVCALPSVTDMACIRKILGSNLGPELKVFWLRICVVFLSLSG